MKFILIIAFCSLMSCANNSAIIKRVENPSKSLKISEMFTGQWVRVKLNNNPECLNRYLYSKGTVEENKKTLVLTQMSSGFNIAKYQCYYERNGIHFAKTIKYLYPHELQELADIAQAENHNVIILTTDEVSEINKLITQRFKINGYSGIVIDQMTAFQLRKKSPVLN